MKERYDLCTQCVMEMYLNIRSYGLLLADTIERLKEQSTKWTNPLYGALQYDIKFSRWFISPSLDCLCPNCPYELEHLVLEQDVNQ